MAERTQLERLEDVLAMAAGLQDTLDGATRALRATKRRFLIWAAGICVISIFVGAYLAVTLHDEHIESCTELGRPLPKHVTTCNRTFFLHEHESIDAVQREALFKLMDEWSDER